MVLQECYKYFIDTRDAQCRKPTAIRHITENMKCDAANSNKIDSVLPYIETRFAVGTQAVFRLVKRDLRQLGIKKKKKKKTEQQQI
jgi:hypothetical protein